MNKLGGNSYGRIFFYTNEGFAQDPAGNDVENCQLIGRAFGDNVEEARNNLIKENSWIKEHGFDEEKLLARNSLHAKCMKLLFALPYPDAVPQI